MNNFPIDFAGGLGFTLTDLLAVIDLSINTFDKAKGFEIKGIKGRLYEIT